MNIKPFIITLIIGIIVIISGFSSSPKKENIKSNTEYNFDKYFPEDEIKVILKAAERNNCYGEDLIILFAIRKAENGSYGKEFGVMNPEANDFDKQAGWCASTIVKNRKRWINSGRTGDFISFLGNKYCPVEDKNDTQGLNKNWIPNVNYWINKLKGE